MRNPFFQNLIGIFETLSDQAKTGLSNFTSNLTQQQNPQSTQTSPEALSAQITVAASLNKRSSASKLSQASTPTPSTSSDTRVGRFGPAAQVPAPARPAPAQTTSAPVPARPAQFTAPAPAQTTPDQNLDENRGFRIENLISFFSQLAKTQKAPAPDRPAPAQAPARPAPDPAREEPVRSAPTPARAEPAPTQAVPALSVPPTASGEVPRISAQLTARIFYDKLEREGNGKVDFSFIKQSQGINLSEHLTQKMNFWKKTLGEKEVNASDISVSSNMRKDEMLLTYAKFLKENIDRTKEVFLPDKEMGKALLTSQEFEMARLRYFVDGLDNTLHPKFAIYQATSEQSRTYASRKDERMRSDPNGTMREEEFINRIQVPNQLKDTDIEIKQGAIDLRSRTIDLLARHINTVCNKSLSKIRTSTSLPGKSPSPSPSPSPSFSKSASLSSLSVSGRSRVDQDKIELREKLDSMPSPAFARDVDSVFNQKLIIGENSVEKRMQNIEKSLFGIDNRRTFNTSDANSETQKGKEGALVEYVDFLKASIKLVKEEIKREEMKRADQKNPDRKIKLQKLQLGLLGEVGKIRGIFPNSQMTQKEKDEEARTLKYSLPNQGNINTDGGRVFKKTGPSREGEFTISSSSQTLNSIDKKIKSIVSLVNPLERQLVRAVNSASELGGDQGNTWAGTRRRDARGPSGGDSGRGR